MTYPVLGIPSSSDIPSQTQSLIQTNFNNIVSWSAIDHIQYGSNNNGTHNQITYSTATSPVPTAATTVGVLYAILDSGSASQLVFVNKNGTLQLTGTGATNLGTGSLTGTGSGSYSVLTLTSGLRMFMGTVGAANGGRTLVMSGHTFGSTVYTATGAGASAGSAPGFSVAPAASTANITINTSVSSALTFLVITN